MTPSRSQTGRISRKRRLLLATLALIAFCFSAPSLQAEEDLVKFLERKKTELSQREDALKKEEERLQVLRKEVDERIARYNDLLTKVEEALKILDKARAERLDHLVRAYEAMPNEEAAERLSDLDEPTAVKIMLGMKSKKAGAVMAAMEPKKAAAITEGMLTVVKKFPAR